MLNAIKLPIKISIENIEIIKISTKENNDKLYKIFNLFKYNIEHLIYWHHDWTNQEFRDIDDMKKYNEDYFCYTILYNKIVIGCINIKKLGIDDEKLSFRTIDYWIDKSYTRKGIMYKCLEKFEKIFMAQGLDYIKVDIDKNNIPSIKLVEKMGFIFKSEWSPDFMIMDEETGQCITWEVYTYIKKLK
jgi:RimJ/RimL family protein N-acetyltransferase